MKKKEDNYLKKLNKSLTTATNGIITGTFKTANSTEFFTLAYPNFGKIFGKTFITTSSIHQILSKNESYNHKYRKVNWRLLKRIYKEKLSLLGDFYLKMYVK